MSTHVHCTDQRHINEHIYVHIHRKPLQPPQSRVAATVANHYLLTRISPRTLSSWAITPPTHRNC